MRVNKVTLLNIVMSSIFSVAILLIITTHLLDSKQLLIAVFCTLTALSTIKLIVVPGKSRTSAIIELCMALLFYIFITFKLFHWTGNLIVLFIYFCLLCFFWLRAFYIARRNFNKEQVRFGNAPIFAFILTLTSIWYIPELLGASIILTKDTSLVSSTNSDRAQTINESKILAQNIKDLVVSMENEFLEQSTSNIVFSRKSQTVSNLISLQSMLIQIGSEQSIINSVVWQQETIIESLERPLQQTTYDSLQIEIDHVYKSIISMD